MFAIEQDDDGRLALVGRFDSMQVERAARVFDALAGAVDVDLARLEYISSMGLGVLVKTQKRLRSAGGTGLRLLDPRPNIRDIFRYSGLDQVFEIDTTG